MKFFPYENFSKKILIFGNTIIYVFLYRFEYFIKTFFTKLKIWLIFDYLNLNLKKCNKKKKIYKILIWITTIINS